MVDRNIGNIGWINSRFAKSNKIYKQIKICNIYIYIYCVLNDAVNLSMIIAPYFIMPKLIATIQTGLDCTDCASSVTFPKATSM